MNKWQSSYFDTGWKMTRCHSDGISIEVREMNKWEKFKNIFTHGFWYKALFWRIEKL